MMSYKGIVPIDTSSSTFPKCNSDDVQMKLLGCHIPMVSFNFSHVSFKTLSSFEGSPFRKPRDVMLSLFDNGAAGDNVSALTLRTL